MYKVFITSILEALSLVSLCLKFFFRDLLVVLSGCIGGLLLGCYYHLGNNWFPIHLIRMVPV